MGRRDKRRTSVLRSKTLAQAEFSSAEQHNPRVPNNAGIVWAGDIIEAFLMEQIQV